MMLLKSLPMAILPGAFLFLGAGRVDVWQFWIYAVVLWLSFAITYMVLQRRNPELLQERFRPPSDRDRATRRIVFPLLFVHWALAGYDVGHLSHHPVPLWAQLIGFLGVVAGFGLAAWTLLSNPFASSAVRIQSERKQHVITTGPYGIVRHPMYLGTVLAVLGSGIALGSLWAALVLLPVIPVFVRRTIKEDRMLMNELPGYPAYAASVPSRLVPGVF